VNGFIRVTFKLFFSQNYSIGTEFCHRDLIVSNLGEDRRNSLVVAVLVAVFAIITDR
jgi:hypothetical protein